MSVLTQLYGRIMKIITKVLITGSNGLLGQKLVKLLNQQADIEVIATSKGKNRIKDVGQFQYEQMDITNSLQTLEVVLRTKPDIIIHTAAITKVEICEQEPKLADLVNVQGTKNLIQAAEAIGVFFLYISTDFVFDGNQGLYKEEDVTNPLNYYGQTKLTAEQLIQSSKLKWAIARTVLVYGIAEDLSRSNIILWVKQSLEAQKTIRVVEDQWRTPTLVEDLAWGCWLIISKRAEGIYHISGKDFLTPHKMALKTAIFFDLDLGLISSTNAKEFVEIGKRPPITGLDISKAKKLLNYKPHSFEEGLAVLKSQLK